MSTSRLPVVTVARAETYTAFRGAAAHVATITLRGASRAQEMAAEAVDLGPWCKRDPYRRGVWHVSQPIPSGAFVATVLGEADRIAVEFHAERAADTIAALLRQV